MSQKNKYNYRDRPLMDFNPSSGKLNHRFLQLSYGANALTGFRSTQQDRYAVLLPPDFVGKWSIFGIYDGHGGEEVAEYLSRKLLLKIRKKLFTVMNISIAIHLAFEEMDEDIRDMPEGEFNSIRESLVKSFPLSAYQPSTSNASTSNPSTSHASTSKASTSRGSNMSAELLHEIKDQIWRHLLETEPKLPKTPDAKLKKNFDVKNNKEDAKHKRKVAKKFPVKTSGHVTRSKAKETSDELQTHFLEKRKDNRKRRYANSEYEYHPRVSNLCMFRRKKDPLVGMWCGSTATVVALTDRTICVGNVGDSRCIVSANGAVFEITCDHIPTLPKERNRIIAADHTVENGRVDGALNMSRAFGDFAFKDKFGAFYSDYAVTAEPSVWEIELNDDMEFIVVASDGIWNYMSNWEVVSFVRSNLNIPNTEICTMIFDYILSKSNDGEGMDNMSMIIIKNDSKCNQTDTLKFDTMDKAMHLEESDTKKERKEKKQIKEENIKSKNSDEIESKTTKAMKRVFSSATEKRKKFKK